MHYEPAEAFRCLTVSSTVDCNMSLARPDAR